MNNSRLILYYKNHFSDLRPTFLFVYAQNHSFVLIPDLQWIMLQTCKDAVLTRLDEYSGGFFGLSALAIMCFVSLFLKYFFLKNLNNDLKFCKFRSFIKYGSLCLLRCFLFECLIITTLFKMQVTLKYWRKLILH